jgi:telomerase reverse transcriptase
MQTSQRFQDYTLRDEEILKAFGCQSDDHKKLKMKVPKRLRGEATRLVQRLQILHSRCSYFELLRHYCPISTVAPKCKPQLSQDRLAADSTVLTANIPLTMTEHRGKRAHWKASNKKEQSKDANLALSLDGRSLVDVATPASQVSAFCQAALSKIIPHGFWGSGNDLIHNRATFLRNVDRLIRLRRYESMSLHDVAQDMKVCGLPHSRRLSKTSSMLDCGHSVARSSRPQRLKDESFG